MASDAEKEIREAAVGYLRSVYPNGRIIHELNIGRYAETRADIACITPDKIVLAELKSRKDTLKRLPRQVKSFYRNCHRMIVIADKKWTANDIYAAMDNRYTGIDSLFFFDREQAEMLAHERAVFEQNPQNHKISNQEWIFGLNSNTWHTSQDYRYPDLLSLLDTMNGIELAAMVRRGGRAVMDNYPKAKAIAVIFKSFTVNQIYALCCAALRERAFAAADAPIPKEGNTHDFL